MTSASTNQPPRRAISALYGMAAGMLLLGLLFGKRDQKNINHIPRPARMLSSALMLTSALLLRREEERAERRGQAGLIAAGAAVDFLGDLIMAKVIPLPKYILFGMLAFGAGHILYIQAFLRRALPYAPGSTRARWTFLGMSWAVALAGWWALVRTPKGDPTLSYAALAYGLLLSSMSGLAATLAAHDRSYMPVALGGGLFLASDTLLASRLFRGAHFPQIGDAVWLSYIAGQGLIVGGMGVID